MIIFLIAVFIVLVVIVWGAACLYLIKETEMGIKVRLGEVREPVDSGLYFVLWPITKIVRFPKTIQTIEFAADDIPTKKGSIPGLAEVIDSVVVKAHFVLYYYFKMENLADSVKYSPGSTEQDLSEEIVPYLQSVIRNALSKMPWMLANEERYKLAQVILSRVVPIDTTKQKYYFLHSENDGKKTVYSFMEYDKDNPDHAQHKPPTEEQLRITCPVIRYGLHNVSLAFNRLEFQDEKLNEAISGQEKARLNRRSIELTAEAEKYKLEREGEGAAYAREQMVKVIESNPELELLYTLREMAQGTSNTLFYQVPRAVEEKVSNILGGNSLGDAMKMLSPEDKKWLMGQIGKLIKKGGGK